ncbi:MAG: tetratricopeptide repeat protein [Bacteroidota bacterium]|nr:tetratricopeptide repeat protein [Bacteroidota bacterium]
MIRAGFLILLIVAGGYQKAFAQTHNEFEQQMLELFNQGKFSEAIPYAIQAKDAAKKEYGDTATRYLLSLTNLAFIYEKMENYAATEPLYTEVISIRKRTVGENHPAYAVALNDLANAYFPSKKFEAALPLYQKAVAIQGKVYGKLHPEYGVIAKNLANLYYEMGQFGKAIPLYEDCMAMTRKLKGDKDPEYYSVLEVLSLAQVDIGNYKAAISLYTELAELYKQKTGENNQDYAMMINLIGRLYLDMADYDNAEFFMKKGMALRKQVLGENHADYAQSVNNMGALYRNRGDFKKARMYYEEALALRKKILGEQHADYAQTMNNLAELAESEGNYAVAESLYKQSIVIRKKAEGEETTFYALSLNNLASLYVSMGKNAEAEALYRQAMAIRKKINGEEHPDYAQSLNNIALVFDNTGRYAEAEQYYKQAIAIRKKVLGEEHPDYAQSLSNLGSLFDNMGKYREAEILFKQALAIRKKINGEEHPDYARVLDNLASLYNVSNDYAAAEPLYQQVIAIRKKVLGETHPDYATSLNNLGALYMVTGRYAEAEKLSKQVLQVYKQSVGEEHPDYAIALHNLGELYRRMGNYKAAEPVLKKAIAIKQKSLGELHPEKTSSLLSLAILYAGTGKYKEAEELLDQSNYIALLHVQNNFTNLSEAEKMQWWEDEASRYEMAPSLLVSNPSPSASYLKKTFTRQMQLKGFVLKDGRKVLEQVRQQGSPQLKLLLNEWQGNKATLAKQYSLPINQQIAKLDSLEKQTTELEKQINQQSSVFRVNQQASQTGFEQVSKSLQQDEAAIEFIRFSYFNKNWTDSILYAAFIVLPGAATPQFVVLCEEKKLSDLLVTKSNSSASYVKQLYRGIEIREKGAADGKKADSLFALVWKPLQPYLKGIKKINIAPAGLLNRIAFTALAIDSNRYLIDEYQLRQYSSVGQIAEEKTGLSASSAADEIVLYGGIDFDAVAAEKNSGKAVAVLPEALQRSIRGGSWSVLPGTMDEVRSISQLFTSHKKSAKIITGNDASEESFKALNGRSPRILHLSTHGFSLPDATRNKNDMAEHNQFSLANNPLLRSGVIMAGANRVWKGGAALPGKEDGILTAYEISNLDLGSTELVVLSACETALGDIRGTEGVFGLQRSFKLAGVQQMILSLWQVPDKETVELMNLFYTHKLNGGSTREAFNKAQEIMRAKYPVYYWAAFVLIE